MGTRPGHHRVPPEETKPLSNPTTINQESDKSVGISGQIKRRKTHNTVSRTAANSRNIATAPRP